MENNIDALKELIIEQVSNASDYDLLDLVYKLLITEGS